jgi:serine protease Do
MKLLKILKKRIELPEIKLPTIRLPRIRLPKIKLPKIKNARFLALVVFLSITFGFLAGAGASIFFYYERLSFDNLGLKQDIFLDKTEDKNDYQPQTSQENAIISVVKNASPAVVTVVVTKNLPIYDFFGRQTGTKKQELGEGSGFIISDDGMVVTNKHVIIDDTAEYTVFINTGKKYSAKVLAKDPVQDLAVIKIEEPDKKLPTVQLGDSNSLQIGQTVVAIGNALGEFRNTVSAGVISGLGRRITASGSEGFVETLDNVIQTDAAINRGNSGGPLLNLKGEVIGINTAVVSDAQSIGFAIPVNKIKIAIEQVKEKGKITYPFIGVRYLMIDQGIKEEKKLSVDYGALLGAGSAGEPAVEPNSAADKAGLKEGDIILQFGGEKITIDNPLSEIILKYRPGDEVDIKILRKGEEEDIKIILGERS